MRALGKCQHAQEEETSGDSTPSHINVTGASTCTPGPCLSASSTRTARSCCIETGKPARRRFSGTLHPSGPTLSSRSTACSPGTWLADRWAQAGLPCGLGHALSLKAIPGGQAKNDKIDAHTIAVLRRGGMLPQASVYPAARRATRALRRRRRPLMRKRAELLTHLHNTKSQSNLPEIGKKSADKANRAGVAERFADPAVPKRLEVDLALISHDDARLRDMAWSVLTTAQEPHTHTRCLRRPVPGLGEILSLVLRYDSHEIHRFPRGQDVVSYCRLVKCAQESAGKRYGTGGTKLGKADLKGACSEAAGVGFC